MLGLTTVQVGTDPLQIATGQDKKDFGIVLGEVCTSVARGMLTGVANGREQYRDIAMEAFAMSVRGFREQKRWGTRTFD